MFLSATNISPFFNDSIIRKFDFEENINLGTIKVKAVTMWINIGHI